MVIDEYNMFHFDTLEFSFIAEIAINGKSYHVMGWYQIDSPENMGKWGKPYFEGISIQFRYKTINVDNMKFIRLAIKNYLQERDR